MAGRIPKTRGTLAEKWVSSQLIQQGYRIEATNRRLAGGEIDIICWDGPVLVFLEVKSRSSNKYGLPEEAVDQHKRARLVAAAQAYLALRKGPPPLCRFDVASVQMEKGKPKDLRLIKDAFRPGE
jgi:putative endonuclease